MTAILVTLVCLLSWADPLCGEPLKPGDAIEIWSGVRWMKFVVEAGQFEIVLVRNDRQVEIPIRRIGRTTWRRPGGPVSRRGIAP